ncbi:uncharacterized protein LOC119720675 [Patiria miniata]|uniref:Superoxide dismutase copper/zinc binding domain-containing protein n=1 Tax=Patiria miniata TaxID=46514 RepID=A0A913Z5W1_PATMI|nr:uncharacterized protein LOC119720675 [Patiria miniata]
MEYLVKSCIVWMGIVLVAVAAQDPTYVATFSMAGASGNATFTRGTGSNTIIRLSMSLPAGTYNWTVREKPTVYDQRPVCSEVFTGGVLANGGDLTTAHGKLTGGTSVTAEFDNDQLKLTGTDSISSRSLVLEETTSGTLICANILDYDVDVVTAVAKFVSPFAGTVTFRQRQGEPSALTTVLVDLYSVLDPQVATYSWGIHSIQDYNKDMNLQQRCSSTMSAIFNPIGDLSSKFGDVTINPASSSRTRYFIDTNLPLDQSANSVLGKNLVFKNSDGTFIACSPIQELLPKAVSAEISVSGVNGTLEFRQRSPYDPTHISVNLAKLRGLAAGYHVHVQPVTGRINTDDQPASNANVGGHYNPFGVIAGDSPAAGTGTHDQYEVGDISGKFGSLSSLDAFSGQFVDWNMQLFGKYSIVGRSIVIHKAEANARWAYGNIGYPTDVVTVKADFSSVVAGKMVFRQDPNDPYSDTTVYVEVTRADGSDPTVNHNFHVHEKPIGNDYLSSSSRCASAAGHFNPFVDFKNGYDLCDFTNPYRCEVGDLSQKLATIDISSSISSSSSKYFFTDPLLPLTGYYSVAGRSVVIHMPDRAAPRLACADLYDAPSISIQTDAWDGGPAIRGPIAISQASEFDRAKVSIELSQLDQLAGGWHIHVLPIDPDNVDAPCSAASVQGHYNPFGADGGQDAPATGTHDMYEVGDLSGKFGSFASLDSITAVYMDTNLDLTGPRSVGGRSLVIHRDDAAGSRMVCSDLDQSVADGDFSIMAQATFQGDAVTGTITLKQIRFASGYQGDTIVQVDLTANDDNIEYVLEIPKTTCDDDDIFNPYQISVPTDQCSVSRMRLCSVGDLRSKHGMVYSNQRVFMTDINLPLYGLNSVIGRNLRISTSTADGGKSCSTIIPDGASGRKINHVYPATTAFDAYGFQTTVANAIASGNRWQVVPSQEPGESTEFPGCSSVDFWVIGPNVENLVTAFSEAVKAGSLDSYNPTDQCSEGSGVSHVIPSGFMILLSTILGLFVIVPLQRDV